MNLSLNKPHNILLSHPRTCSHLFVKILNLAAQSKIHTVCSDGYHFLPATTYRLQNDLAGNASAEWTLMDRQQLLAKFQDSYDDLLNSMKRAESRAQNLYFKEHVAWLIEPSSESAFINETGKEDITIDECIIMPKRGQRNCETELQVQPPLRSPGNETCLPDSVLKTFNPTFLIRHPALAFPSSLRTSLSSEGSSLAGVASDKREAVARIIKTARWEMTYHWSRTLFDWYSDNLSATERQTPVKDVLWPVIIDADDIVDKALIEKYCEVSGLDTSKVRWEWDAVDARKREKMSGAAKKMMATIISSEGIIPGKTAEGLVVEAERLKWVEEFGQELADILTEHVDNAIADYQYLRQKSLRLTS